MKYAPIGIGAAIAVTVGHSGIDVLVNLGKLILTLYGALVVFFLLVLFPIALIARVPIKKFLAAVKEPSLIAFSTTSSEAALPSAMQAMERIGVPRRIVAFVMPTGYSFNMDGTTLYLSLAAVFAGTLATFGLPLEAVAVILGVDELMDMARTTTNLIGNCLATVVMARWEGEFNPDAPAATA
jgi:proton glutamate symport protein